jgi:hypothetical protein
LPAFRRLLGESVARIFDEREYGNAEKLLNQAEEYLRVRSLERAKIWYLLTSTSVSGFMLLICFFIWLFKPSVLTPKAYEVALISLLGSLGSFISVISRLQKISMNASAGPLIHCLEGATRVMVGVGGAFLVAIAMKAQLILGVTNSVTNSIDIQAVIGVVAGASERFVPDLIKRFEGSFSSSEWKAE